MPKFLSDDDMSKLEGAQPATSTASSPSKSSAKIISDDDMAKLEKSQSPGLLRQAGEIGLLGLGKLGQKIDSYTGAPTRSALGKLIDKPTDFSGAASAFKSQFGEEPSRAPSGTDLARQLGVPDKPVTDYPTALSFTPPLARAALALAKPNVSTLAGGAISALADPMLLAGPLSKGARSLEGVNAAEDIARGLIRKGVAKGGEALTGLPAASTEEYIKNPDLIKAIMKEGPEAARKASSAEANPTSVLKRDIFNKRNPEANLGQSDVDQGLIKAADDIKNSGILPKDKGFMRALIFDRLASHAGLPAEVAAGAIQSPAVLKGLINAEDKLEKASPALLKGAQGIRAYGAQVEK